jgi:transposase
MVEDSYCEDNGRPSLDPVILIKLPVIQYMFGIRSMRQTIQEIKVNNAYRWFLGLGLRDAVPHFSTFGKNYMRRFQDTDLFERIFQRILKECMEVGLVDESVVFVDSTHVKARANSKKYEDVIVEEQAQWYEKELREEIDRDRAAHGKKPIKDAAEESKNDEGPKPPKDSGKGKPNPNTSKKKQARQKKEKHIKQSKSDPESGWFRKGEHKHVFAYSVETACDINGVVLGYSVHPGNENDGKTFPAVYEKIKHLNIDVMVGDTAYKTPAIAQKMKEDGIALVSTYSGPKTKDGFFPKYEYVYDEYYDCYLCPANEILHYSTTNRDGYREYKSNPKICAQCPHLSQCTLSKDHVKVVTRHVWQGAVDEADENRYRYDLKDLYKYRKETIERIFGLAKELHGFRYTQQFGKAQMEVKAALTYACMNLKKLAKKRWKTGPVSSFLQFFLGFFSEIFNIHATNPLPA